MEEEKKQDQGFWLRVASFIVDKRKAIFILFIIAIIYSVICMNLVDVNQDITSYLPDTSETRIGLDKMDEQFTTYATAKVMITNITYENGADVPTAFLTNLDVYLLRSCPDLAKQIEAANMANIAKVRKQVPKYKYPDYVVTAADLGYLAKWGIDFRVMAEDCFFIRSLESQKAHGKAIFGSGFLLSESVAAEKAAAEKAAVKCWELSESERRIIKSLGHAHKHERDTNGQETD